MCNMRSHSVSMLIGGPLELGNISVPSAYELILNVLKTLVKGKSVRCHDK